MLSARIAEHTVNTLPDTAQQLEPSSVARPGVISRFAGFFRYTPTLPPEEITYAERKRSMRKVIMAWCFGTVFIDGIGGTPAVGLFRLLGATPAWIGVLAALGSFATLIQPVSSYIIARTGSRKRYFLGVSYPGRLAWLPIVALAFVLPHGRLSTILIMFVFVLISRVSLALSHPAWFSWVSELSPENELGEFWGARQMWGRISGMVALVALNYYLGAEPTLVQFAVFFSILTVFGWLDIFIHRGVTGVKMDMSREERPAFMQMISEPLGDPRFRPLLMFSIFFAFANQLGGGMLHLMFLEEYQLSFFEISLYIPGLLGITWIVGSRLWGRLVDNIREGDRLVFFVCSAGVATHILIFPLIEARQHSLIALTIILGGLSWSGYLVSTTALMIGLSPTHSRPRYVATHMLFFGIGNMAGAVLAGQLAEAFAGISYVLGPFHLTQFRGLYFLSAILRVCCLALLPMIRQPDSRPIGVFARHIFSLNPFQRGTWVYVRRKLTSPVRRESDDE